MSPGPERTAAGMDLARFARTLGERLVEQNRRRDDLVEVGDIFELLVPYRTHRSILSIESHEDYESLILRLCAGEGGFAVTEPPGIAEVFRDQTDSPNPDLSIVSDLRSTLIRLVPGALAAAAPDVHAERYAPPSPELEDVTGPELPFLVEPEGESEPRTPDPVTPDTENPSPVPEPEAAPAEQHCEYCGGSLPAGRPVNFCPHCGESQTRIHCPECGQEAEAGWRHCVGCGHTFNEN